MIRQTSVAVLIVMLFGGAILLAAPEAANKSNSAEAKPAKVTPKPLSDNVKKGLAYLVKRQLPGGGWGQGEESAKMGGGGALQSKPNVADSCMAIFALVRSGSTPKSGEYSKAILKGLEYICSEIEKSPEKGLSITSQKGTRVQQKIGPYIDTFLAANVLADVKDNMPDDKGTKRIAAAIHKVMDKIEKNQRKDGSWDNKSWAGTLGQSIATRAVNNVAAKGVKVKDSVRDKATTFAAKDFDSKTGKFSKGAGSAGVELYSGGASLNGMQQAEVRNGQLRIAYAKKLERKDTSDKERAEIKKQLKNFADNKAKLDKARKAIVKRMEDKKFIAGFGSNGGEEFLSHLNIGEALVLKGGEDWAKWDKTMTRNMNRIQNKDGSWTGHHCITGRTFCTSAALLVLMVDRAPAHLGGVIKRR